MELTSKFKRLKTLGNSDDVRDYKDSTYLAEKKAQQSRLIVREKMEVKQKITKKPYTDRDRSYIENYVLGDLTKTELYNLIPDKKKSSIDQAVSRVRQKLGIARKYTQPNKETQKFDKINKDELNGLTGETLGDDFDFDDCGVFETNTKVDVSDKTAKTKTQCNTDELLVVQAKSLEGIQAIRPRYTPMGKDTQTLLQALNQRYKPASLEGGKIKVIHLDMIVYSSDSLEKCQGYAQALEDLSYDGVVLVEFHEK